ncbi:MAG: DUF1549 domain-containing protein, partial [Pirellulales bacterium]|nr:DUF1549 domain-containing protein [Pirellulales bacterium]
MIVSRQNNSMRYGGWVRLGALFVAWLAASGVLQAEESHPESKEPIDFSRDIRPLLSDRCFHCHGPDAGQRQADLRFDTQEGAFADLGGYRAVEPGDIAASELIARITSSDTDVRMPPPESDRSLSPAEIEKFKRWIAEGAAWEGHWAFQPIAATDIPRENNPLWIRNPIDAFVLDRLEAEGFAPARPIDRAGLLRRVSLSLTGLPPTLEQLDRFLSDTDPDAYEKVVDQLLDSTRFAERVTSIWLDAARYSDTYGYQVDRDRYVWPWRDWVIDAINANVPYDEFIHQQLAGDLLPDAGPSQILATTFNRLHPQKTEGGSVPEEFRTQYVADRLETVSTAVMGLTMECCRCHDHKYDPISQREYYQLFAFFNNIDEAGLYSYSTQSVPTPTLNLPTDAQRQAMATAAERVTRAEADLVAVADREKSGASRHHTKGPPVPIASLDFEQELPRGGTAVDGFRGRGAAISGDDEVGTPIGDFRRYDGFTIALAMRAREYPERAVIFHRSLGWTDAGSRGYELLVEDGRLSAALVHFWPGNAIRIRTQEKMPLDRWFHVAVSYNGSSRAEGLALYIDGQKCEV